MGHPRRGASQVEISTRLNWATQFLTGAYDGADSPNVSIRLSCIFLRHIALLKKKIDSSRLDVVEIVRVA